MTARVRAAAAVADLVAGARHGGVWLPRVASVAVGEDGAVAVKLVDDPPGRLPAGWQRSGSDPRLVRLSTDAAAGPSGARDDVRPLVAVGECVESAARVFVPLDTCGLLTVSGPDDEVTAVLAGWTRELAASRVLVVAVGFDDRTRAGLPDAVSTVASPRHAAHAVRLATAATVVVCAPSVPEVEAAAVRDDETPGRVVAVVYAGAARARVQGWHARVSAEEISVFCVTEGIGIRGRRLPASTHPTGAPAAAVPAVGRPSRRAVEAVAQISVPAGSPDVADTAGVVVVRLFGEVHATPPGGDRLPSGRMTEPIAQQLQLRATSDPGSCLLTAVYADSRCLTLGKARHRRLQDSLAGRPAMPG